jgi:hypothetical protein
MSSFKLNVAAIVTLLIALAVVITFIAVRPGKNHTPVSKPTDQTLQSSIEDVQQDLLVEEIEQTQQTANGVKAGHTPPKVEGQIQLADLKQQSSAFTKKSHPQAEKLYRMAISLKETGNSSYASNRTIIACCRQLIEEYPNSQRAEKAKKLLQQVPEQFRKRYDEEMSFLRPREPKVRKSKRLRRRMPDLPREQHDITIEETAD